MHLQTQRDSVTGEPTGLGLVVREERPAGLRLEHVGGWKVRLRARDRVLLWAHPRLRLDGVWLLRGRGEASPGILPPITAREARATTEPMGWMKRFARALERSAASPLGRGTWELSELVPSAGPHASCSAARRGDARSARDPERGPPDAYGLRASLTLPHVWFEPWGVNGSLGVFPLRDAPSSETARLRAWRKHAREGTLPPVLLYWVGALDMYLLVDGHIRLQAALEEDVSPCVIALWQPQVLRFEGADSWRSPLVEKYERAFEHERQLTVETRRTLGRRLAAAFAEHRVPVTTARHRPGAEGAWNDEVRHELSDDPERCAAFLEGREG
ncbi:MAG: hypothetical protein KC619_08795 [Myxococcales bacterium]|nr:hypothetical protein [Myxococcales bacterium]